MPKVLVEIKELAYSKASYQKVPDDASSPPAVGAPRRADMGRREVLARRGR